MKKKYLFAGILFIILLVIVFVFARKENTKAVGVTEKGISPEVVIAEGSNTNDLILLSLKAIGGLESLNLEGKRILIKPSILYDGTNELYTSTNPDLVFKTIDMCYDAGAWEVYVTDHTSGNWTKCYKNSGIEKSSKQAFGKIIPGDDMRYYIRGKAEPEDTTMMVHRLLEKCDVVINIAALSVSEEGIVRGGLYNLSGLTRGNRTSFEKTKDKKWIDFFKCYRPVLTIIDATRADTAIGNNEKWLYKKPMIIVSKDPLLAEATAMEITESSSSDDSFLMSLEKEGLGNLNTSEASLQYIRAE